MSAIRRIICLANSRKVSGRCIAGKDIGTGNWIRPVSDRPSGEISEEERRYEDGTSAQMLDLIDIPVVGRAPGGHQAENYLIDPNDYWKRAGTMPRSGLSVFQDHSDALWKIGDSTVGGQNDRVRMSGAAIPAASLYLICPENLTLHVVSDSVGVIKLRRRVRSSFSYHGTRYNLVVTDPMVEQAFLAKSDGAYPLDAAFVCVSLSEVFSDGYSYKLVAAII
jgi:hypothetical protein